MSKKRLGFLINQDRCLGCQACEIACKQESNIPIGIRWRQVREIVEGTGNNIKRTFLSISCNHCDEPECLKVCPVNAYYKREDGIVIHDETKCIGCKLCTMACPYHSPHFNKDTGTVEKCELCYERIDNNLEPSCVLACPVKAIQLVDINEVSEKYLKDVPGFPNSSLTIPAVRFKPPQNKKLRGRGY